VKHRKTTRDDEKIRRANMRSANHFALIRSILIDSGLSTAPRAHFFANYFCAMHDTNSNAKKSARSRFVRSIFRKTDVREEKSDVQKNLISSRYLQRRYFRADVAAQRRAKHRGAAFVFACDWF
jgi:hypothetical protein